MTKRHVYTTSISFLKTVFPFSFKTRLIFNSETIRKKSRKIKKKFSHFFSKSQNFPQFAEFEKLFQKNLQKKKFITLDVETC